MRILAYLVGTVICGVLLNYIVICLLQLADYIYFLFTRGVDIANFEADKMRIYGYASNMSSMLAIGVLYGLMLFLICVGCRISFGYWPHQR